MSTTSSEAANTLGAAESQRLEAPVKVMETWANEQTFAGLIFRREEREARGIDFWVVPLKNATEQRAILVPDAAREDLGRVFAHGGSFAKAALSHMPEAWGLLVSVHPSFAALLEDLEIRKSVPDAPREGRWVVKKGRPTL